MLYKLVKKFFMLTIILLGTGQLFASPAGPNSKITVVMQSYIERRTIVLDITNNSRTDYVVSVSPGGDSNLLSAGFNRQIIASGKTANLVLTFSDISRGDLVAVVDYSVTYAPSGSRGSLKAFNPIQYFVQTGGKWVQKNALIQIRANQKFVKTNRPEPVSDSSVDLGAGLRGNTTLTAKDFPVYFEIETPSGRPTSRPFPKDLANSIPFMALPRGEGVEVSAGMMTPANLSPLPNFISAWDNSSINCGIGLKCITGELHIINEFLKPSVPGWGWRVEAWNINVTPWTIITSTEVDSNGKWILPVTGFGTPVNDQYYIVYKPSNRYLEVRDPITKKAYQFGFVTNTYVNKKSFIMPNKSLTGLGRLFGYGNDLWHKLVASGVNPVGKTQNFIYFPNTLDSNNVSPCTLGTVEDKNLIAWSCSTGGDLYLIPEHANQETTAHELSHNLMLLFWGGFPAGSGGDHYYGKCYNQGLALSEGFADFMSWWAASSSNELASSFADAENYVKTCTKKGTSDEIAVAATFWDLYDNATDSHAISGGTMKTDQIFFVGKGDVIAELLKNKMILGMNSFRAKLITAHMDFKDYITDLFMMNDTHANE